MKGPRRWSPCAQRLLGDANVLYSRVVRDYLLYAMAHQLIRVTWSAEILGEVVEHLIENVEGFDVAAGERLVAAMNGTFPYAQVDLTAEARAAVSEFTLPDKDDRHVIAAAVSAEAAFLCTEDRTGFPPDVLAELGIEAVTPDELFCTLIEVVPEAMLEVHRTVVARLRGATDESTIAALRASRVRGAAELMDGLLRRS